jgi:hypothetical protein
MMRRERMMRLCHQRPSACTSTEGGIRLFTWAGGAMLCHVLPKALRQWNMGLVAYCEPGGAHSRV